MKRCIVCEKVPGLEKRVNLEGLKFCSDDCYDEHDNSPNDITHPYIDDYEMIRLEYIWWIENYENEWYDSIETGKPEKEEILETLDEIFDEFYDYYRLGGEDGIFSQEIYRYLRELEDFRATIEQWYQKVNNSNCQ